MAAQLPVEQFGPEDFLNRVVPSDGYTVIAWKDDRFRHKVFQDFSSAAAFAKQQAFQRRDAYFALASYKEGFHKAPDGRMVLRTQDNVKSLQSLWVDIDVGKGGYQTANEAIRDIQRFCTAIKLPIPNILVSSGAGLHAYWTFTNAVDISEWTGLALALKAACLSKAFKIDPVCTSDAARILRLPGTYNYKQPDKPQSVEVIYALNADYPVADLQASLLPWMDPLSGGNASIYKDDLNDNEDLTANCVVTHKPKFLKNIVQRCGVLREVHKTNGRDCSEPYWVAVLQLAKACDDGEEFIHVLSSGHPDYNEEATIRKFNERVRNPYGATLCKTFEQFAPKACAACPHNGQIRSPVSLGGEDYRDPYGLPFPFRDAGGRIEIFSRAKDDDDAGDWQPYLDFAPTELAVYEFEDGKLTYDFRLSGKGPTPHIAIPASVVGSQELKPTMSGFGYHLNDKESTMRFASVMKAWQEQLYAAKAVKQGVRHLGWQEKSGAFCTGRTNFYADGSNTDRLHPPREFEQYAKNYEVVGDLAVWQKEANHLVAQDIHGLSAVVASAFAAPLIQFTGNGGFAVSVVSGSSGMGKSTAMKIAQSVWANPGAISSINDTENAVTHKLGFLKNLPAYWDEIRGEQSMDALAKVVFRISEGKSKARLSSSAILQAEYHWDTLLLSASNSSLLEHISCGDQHTDAGMLRIFEFELARDLSGLVGPDTTVLRGNYGCAGAVYGKFLAENQASVKKDIQAFREHIRQKYNPKPRERFWFDAYIVLLLGAKYAKQLGLVEFDLQGLSEFLMGILESLRKEHTNVVAERTSSTVVARYVHEHFAERLVTDTLGGLSTKSVVVKHVPARDVPIFQLAEDEKTLVIQRGHFKDWAKRRGYPASLYKQVSRMNGVHETLPISIGAYTPYKQGRARCWTFDLSADPVLSGLTD